jgi:hypothetical protein
VRPHRGSPDNGVARPREQSFGGDLLEPYARLAALVESERDHAVAGRIDELLEVQAQGVALAAALPARAPEGARPHLLRAAAARAEVTAALASAMRAARADAMRVDQGRTAVAAYRPVAPVVPGIAHRG